MTYRSVMMEITADCPRCGGAVRVPGVVDVLACTHCGGTTALPPSFWRRALSEPVYESLGLPDGKGRSGVLRATPKLKLVYGPMAARCNQCKQPLPLDGLAESVADGVDGMFCPECGTRNSVRRAPDWFRTVAPAAVGIVNETVPSLESSDSAFHCFNCAAQVPVGKGGGLLRCPQCGERVSIPGGIRRRLGADTATGRWFVLVDMGKTEGALPLTMEALCDIGIEPYGRMMVAWHPARTRRSDKASRLALVDYNGLLVWMNDAIYFGPETTLHACPASGRTVLVDQNENQIHYLDPLTGRLLWTMPSIEEDDSREGIDLRDHRGFAVDADGTLLVMHAHSSNQLRLRRYGPDGTRVALWSGMELRQEDSAAKKGVSSWDAVAHRPVRLPADTLLTVGWDRNLYLASAKDARILQYGTDGTCLGVMRPKSEEVAELKRVGVDREGNVTVLFAHARAIGSSNYDHVARLGPDGTVKLWLGAHVDNSPVLLGPECNWMKTMPDGTVFLGSTLEQLRIVRPSGKVAWESPMTARYDKQLVDKVSRGRRRGRRTWN